tara:strand:+ start:149 stop:1438 length:1290 start_codon:yes stop_codon:yes gene_type:complete
MKIKYYIPQTNDTQKNVSTSFLLQVSKKNEFPRLYQNGKIIRTNNFGETQISVERPNIRTASRVGQEDPMLGLVTLSIKENLFPLRGNTERFLNQVTFKYPDGEAEFYYGKTSNDSKIALYGGDHWEPIKFNKGDAQKTLAKIILRSVLTRSAEVMNEYINRCLKIPPNVWYALENRTPFEFWHMGNKQECLINTRLIGEKEAALEISEGIWASISIVDLNTFINTHKHKSSKSKLWSRITPSQLWSRLFGEEPTEAQTKLSTAWLMQNRTNDMVENQATRLLFQLDREYENIHFVQFKNPSNRALFVRGKLFDWVIADEGGGMKRGHQNVNTYRVLGDGNTWKGCSLQGPICIDNLHNNSSIGDQLSARALILMNDQMAGPLIYTIRHTIENMLKSGGEGHRLNIGKLIKWSEKADLKYRQKKMEASQ